MKDGDIIFGAIVIALFFFGLGYMSGFNSGQDDGYDWGYDIGHRDGLEFGNDIFKSLFDDYNELKDECFDYIFIENPNYDPSIWDSEKYIKRNYTLKDEEACCLKDEKTLRCPMGSDRFVGEVTLTAEGIFYNNSKIENCIDTEILEGEA